MRKNAAGIGYGFVIGAGVGLAIGVIVRNLLFWTGVGVISGIIVGWLISLVLD